MHDGGATVDCIARACLKRPWFKERNGQRNKQRQNDRIRILKYK